MSGQGITVAIAFVGAFLTARASGCAPRPECAPAALDVIELEYVRAVRAACPHGEPCAALAEIEARYYQRREGWILCGSE